MPGLVRNALLCVIVVLVAGVGSGLLVGARGEDGPVTANVELVLDSSGSMAEQLADGTTKIDTAKGVLTDVVGGLPDSDDLNVGFRVFGQAGDNTAEGRPESCASTELVVPIDGVDRDALLGAIDGYQPVGWTPIALALETAAGDFEAGDDVSNSIILVTDGEETCGGDPCAVATALAEADVALRIDVVGFGTTEEQNAALSCISANSGGGLYEVGDGVELNDAIIEILDERQLFETPTPTPPQVTIVDEDSVLADCEALAEDPAAIFAIDNSATGTDGDDIIIGSNDTDTISGLGGDDVICGLEGGDVLNGQAGDDILIGGDGDDLIAGNAGDDAIDAGAGNDNVNGALSDAGDSDLVLGGEGDDAVSGTEGDDFLAGGPGEDTVSGAGGDDTCATGDGQSLSDCEDEVDLDAILEEAETRRAD